ncbi:MAG TPA: hypothetical protein VK356_03030 [Thermomicrobiales bacterium]|nr:hypothetical protein [Thermomicrobiales bacterium]
MHQRRGRKPGRHGSWRYVPAHRLTDSIRLRPASHEPLGAPLVEDGVDLRFGLGHPGPANAAMGEIFALQILPNMMARAATMQQTPEESVAEAEAEINAIFDKWRAEGLMGGGA